jgi:hypothetical protein
LEGLWGFIPSAHGVGGSGVLVMGTGPTGTQWRGALRGRAGVIGLRHEGAEGALDRKGADVVESANACGATAGVGI